MDLRSALKQAFPEAKVPKPKKEESPYTPWNPAAWAVKRVKNPIPAPTVCPHCGSGVSIVKNSTIYGRNYGNWPWAYACEKLKDGCKTYVGMHPHTGIPLGTLANEELRDWRKKAKEEFSLLHTAEGPPTEGYLQPEMTRDQAYAWLAQAMGLEHEQTHFGWFDVAQCQLAHKLCHDKVMELIDKWMDEDD